MCVCMSVIFLCFVSHGLRAYPAPVSLCVCVCVSHTRCVARVSPVHLPPVPRVLSLPSLYWQLGVVISRVRSAWVTHTHTHMDTYMQQCLEYTHIHTHGRVRSAWVTHIHTHICTRPHTHSRVSSASQRTSERDVSDHTDRHTQARVRTETSRAEPGRKHTRTHAHTHTHTHTHLTHGPGQFSPTQ